MGHKRLRKYALTIKKRALVGVLALFSFIFSVSAVFADEVNYSYDDAGRLVRVEKDTDRVLYQYDEVGNLILITRETGASQPLAPTLQGIAPHSFIIGDTYSIAITGQNLLSAGSVTSNNPGITVKNVTALDTTVVATLSVAAGASPGQANITVTTSYGSASISVNIYQANISPQTAGLFPGGAMSFSVSLAPSATETLSAPISNNAPGILEMQPSVAIPPGGSANFMVNAIQGGTGTIQVGTAVATVRVIGGNTLINAQPVSVTMGSFPGNSVVYSLPVSLSINAAPSGPATVYNAVGVAWPLSAVAGAVTVSLPVCIQIGGN